MNLLRTYPIQAVIALLVLCGMGYVGWTAMPDASQATAEQGAPAPEIALVGLDGQARTLSDELGKTVLVNFWASWCTPCVNELPLLNEAYKLAVGGGEQVELLAVNLGESARTVQQFADRYGLQFPILLDESGSLKKPYRVASLPMTLVISPDGTISNIHVGELDDMSEILSLMRPTASALKAAARR